MLATSQRLPLKGTLRVLLDGKEADLIEEVKPLRDRLHELRSRIAPHSRTTVLDLAGEPVAGSVRAASRPPHQRAAVRCFGVTAADEDDGWTCSGPISLIS
ncbi:MAG: hypothetical protein AB1714_13035 [Acidobacteriota bacterium]